MLNKITKGSECATLKYATLVEGLLWAGGNWEAADTREALYPPPFSLKAGHTFSFLKVTLLPSPVPGRGGWTAHHWRRHRLECITHLIAITLIFHLSPHVFVSPEFTNPVSPLSGHFSTNLLFYVKMVYKLSGLNASLGSHFLYCENYVYKN